jgi:hypothetical protein
MNLRFRINQILNSLSAKRKESYDWIFVYGVPRSGTTYFYQELLQLGKHGVSDYDLGKFAPAFQHIEKSGYIPIDTNEIKELLGDQILSRSAPGAGNQFDFIVKQVNTNLAEYELLCELMGSTPKAKYFLFREPSGWLPSAMKKYNINKKEAEAMYESSIRSFDVIGGVRLEYGDQITKELQKLKIKSLTPFSPKSKEATYSIGDSLDQLYNAIKHEEKK